MKNDAELLVDAQLMLGMIERYRPGTLREARVWFGGHLAALNAQAKASGGEVMLDAEQQGIG